MPDTKTRPRPATVCIWCRRSAAQCVHDPCDKRSGNDSGNVVKRFPRKSR